MMMRWTIALFVMSIGIASVAQASGNPCLFALRSFSDGAVSCQGGRQFRCANGDWQSIGTTCADADPTDSGVRVRPGVSQPSVNDPTVKVPSVNQPAGSIAQPAAP